LRRPRHRIPTSESLFWTSVSSAYKAQTKKELRVRTPARRDHLSGHFPCLWLPTNGPQAHPNTPNNKNSIFSIAAYKSDHPLRFFLLCLLALRCVMIGCVHSPNHVGQKEGVVTVGANETKKIVCLRRLPWRHLPPPPPSPKKRPIFGLEVR
jgi:hypothetical protein